MLGELSERGLQLIDQTTNLILEIRAERIEITIQIPT
jgi:hypothetical protein